MERSRWQPFNTTNPMTTAKTNPSTFPSIFRNHQTNPSRATTTNYRSFQSQHNGNINDIAKRRNAKSNKQIIKLIKFSIIRIFSSYPIWIQAIITSIIGFIAYFFYDYAIGNESITSYLAYKSISFIMFLISVSFLYIFTINITNNYSSSSSSIRSTSRYPANTNTNQHNPYLSNTSNINNNNNTNNNINNNNINNINNINNNKPSQQSQSKRDDLFFTNKAMLNRVSSSTYNVEPKFDYNSSPTKIASLHPDKIVNHDKLHQFLSKQHDNKSRHSLQQSSMQRAPSSVLTTPMTGSSVINKTPIGKTFGSMQMTPAIPLFDTPKSINNTNQGSAGMYTPNSSNMDVTMISYDRDNDEPFNADFSAIQGSPISKQQSTSWNISGFGGFVGGGIGTAPTGLADVSTIAQHGTPARNGNIGGRNISGIGGIGGIGTAAGGGGGGGYIYDGMYSDINLRGDNIGQVQQNNNLNTIQQQQQQQMEMRRQRKVINVTRTAPISPFSRKRDMNLDKNKSNKDRMSPVVFTSMGVKKSQFAAFYMEQSINLYEELRIDGLIANWGESMRWWLSEMVKTRCNELYKNDNNIASIFNLLERKYNLKQQLSQFTTSSQRESFIISNENQLLNVAKQENNPSIMHIIQKRKHLKDCIDFICNNYKPLNMNQRITEYVYDRIKQLSSTNNLTLFNWNGGDDKIWQQMMYPTDAHLLMTLFCRYMDDAMCPAVKFSEKHYIEISINDIKKIDKLYKKFKDVAIICVSDTKYFVDNNNNMKNKNFYGKKNDEFKDYKDITAQDSLPYYFIAFNKKKYSKIIKKFSNNQHNKSSLIQKPKHFLYSAWNSGLNNINNSFNHYIFGIKHEEKTDLSDDDVVDDINDYYHDPSKQRSHGHGRLNKKKRHKDSVGCWFPQPGKNNLLHTITLFAIFIHKCCDDKLTGIDLKVQGCTLLQPILR